MAETLDYKTYPTTPKGMQLLYEISAPTWQKWIKPIADKLRKNAKVFKPHEVKIIIDFLEAP